MEVYLEKGVKGTEMGDIAKRAKMARGLVYYYFKEKKALFRELFADYMEKAKAFNEDMNDSTGDPLLRLERYADFYIESGISQPHFVRFYMNLQRDIALVFEDQAAEMLEDFLQYMTRPVVDTLQEAMNAGKLVKTDPYMAARIYWGGVFGAMNYFLEQTGADWSNRDAAQKEALKKKAMEIIFQGLIKR